MRAALEGREGLVPFGRWFRDNEGAIQKLVSRGSYLRLKTRPLPEFRRLLKEHGVPFSESPNAYLPRRPGDYSWIKSSWLTQRVFPYRQSPTSLADVDRILVDELLHMVDIKQTGDELWSFSSPPATWEHKMGRAGIALVREGSVVYAIVTVLS